VAESWIVPPVKANQETVANSSFFFCQLPFRYPALGSRKGFDGLHALHPCKDLGLLTSWEIWDGWNARVSVILSNIKKQTSLWVTVGVISKSENNNIANWWP
jgi:hypothetical protein